MFRVWHIPQVPMKPFHVSVNGLSEAKKILEVLADYDIFQYKNNVKGDYANAAGLEVFNHETRKWEEWENEEGYGIDEFNPTVS